jgi:DNA-binding NtrC family response regulator
MTIVAVIDDDEAFLALMHDALEEEGYQVVSATTAKAGYDLIVRTLPSLIMLDIRMEHPQAGTVLLDLLQSHQRARQIPVIICSGDQRFLQEKQSRLRKKGFQILAKPWMLDDMLRMVKATVAMADRAMDPHAIARTARTPAHAGASGPLCALNYESYRG